MRLITNKYGSVVLPYDSELFEWLRKTYPYSEYYVLESQQ